MTGKNDTPRLGTYATKEVTPLILEFCEWLTAETGAKVDPRSVYLGSALRARFQQERRAAKTTPAPARKRTTRKSTAKEQSA